MKQKPPTPEQEHAIYHDLSPRDAAPMIGCKSAAHVRRLIVLHELEATNIGTGKIARYMVSREAIADFKRRRKLEARTRGEAA